MENELAVDLSKPKWDQKTYLGRAKHFFAVTDPRNVFLTPQKLEDAKTLLQLYKQGKQPAGTSEDDLWVAKYRYDSAFHPDTGEKMLLIGRMSSQVPMNMTITGCMLTFYKTTPTVIFWQWINQSFNAIVNYTNRSGSSPISTTQLFKSYCLATTGAVTVALGLNSLVKKAPPLVGRFVPFAAVAAANCINIPLMRGEELKKGIMVTDSNGNDLVKSKLVGKRAISMVVASRIIMALPGMAIPPLIMQKLERGRFLRRYPFMNAPIQVGIVGLCLVFATPMCCALFPQTSSMPVSKLEPDVQDRIQEIGMERGEQIDTIYFNKGL